MAVTRPLTVTSRVDSSSMPPALTPLGSPSKRMLTVVSMVSSRRISWRSTWMTLFLTRSSVSSLTIALWPRFWPSKVTSSTACMPALVCERLAQHVRLDGDEDGVLAVAVDDAGDEPRLAQPLGGAGAG